MDLAYNLFDNKLGADDFFLNYLKNNFTNIDNYLKDINSKEKLNYIYTQIKPGDPNSIAYAFCYLYYYAKLLMEFNNCNSPLINPTILNNLANSLSMYYHNLKQYTGFNQNNYTQIFVHPDVLQNLYNTVNDVKTRINTDFARYFRNADINILNGGRKNRKSKKQRKDRKSKKQRKNRI